MTFDVELFLTTFATLLVIADPFGNLPVFLALTQRNTRSERNRIGWQSVLTSAIVLATFGLFGRFILDLLGISVEAMQISGGILLLLVSLQLMSGSTEKEPTPEQTKVNVALVPLGVPLMAGPGAIVAIMIAVQDARTSSFGAVGGMLAVGAAFIILHLVELIVFRFANPLHRLLGEGGTVFLTRISGMLLSAISVQLIISGILGVIAAQS
ncbi:multiple antibiotic resistance protein [Actinobaculum suis]|uniref:UPF0056 membrane protein n=1 Tax=Actinobaculum suis TaxID=1657 RepID=A0A0K9EUG6_9ACTO|nr:MarC family protein [Actinobaculum suis]KMY23487.1 antibiotic resistance protein MarC [Actinobaculum suis]MDY5153356.1 MarC family protein [Actinobaculum suis]OCA95994.1 antibiotic resistance protein MarC [Actinobaculum suis]OCA96222.1 antibiotic resistance protein MarC [Actinobaculum suis]SDE48858.1 multiple antibiotic resistance protein [Actinobaculum suis]